MPGQNGITSITPTRRFTDMMPSKAIKLPWIVGYSPEEIEEATAQGVELPGPEFIYSLEQLLTFDEFVVDDVKDLNDREIELYNRKQEIERAFKLKWSEHDARKRGATADDQSILQTAVAFLVQRGENGRIQSPRDILTNMRLFLGSAEAATSQPPSAEEDAAFRLDLDLHNAGLRQIEADRKLISREWDHRVITHTLAYVKWPFEPPALAARKPETWAKVFGQNMADAITSWLASKGVEEAREQILGPLSRRPQRSN